MESNQNGDADGNIDEAFPVDKNYRSDWNQQANYDNYSSSSLPHHANQPQPQQHQPFYPSYEHQSSSFPYNHQQQSYAPPNYGHTQQHYQPSHHAQNPPYYQQNSHQNYQTAAATQPIPTSASYQNPPPVSYSYQQQYQTTTFPTQPQVEPYNHPTYTPPATTVTHQVHYGKDYRIETAPYQRESPMQRIQQLARQKHGGQLAAQSAAVAAAVAPRRISPVLRPPRKEGEEETVRDVLHRQYLEQKKLEQEKMQQQHKYPPFDTVAFPYAYPSSSLIPSALSTPTHSSIYETAQPPQPLTTAHLDAPSAPSTPIFTFPLVTGTRTRTPTPLHGVSSPSERAPSVVHSPSGEPVKTLENPTNSFDYFMPNVVSLGNPYAGDEISDQLKTKSLISKLHHANTMAMQTNGSVEEMTFSGLHQAATVVQSLESKEKATPPTASPLPLSRKRTLDHSASPLIQGVRQEMNENGEKVEKVYVLLHHCNIRDPEYNPRGVIKSLEDIEKDKKRDDMFTLSYSSAVCPYEMVDFRIRMPPRVDSPVTSSPSSSSSSSSSTSQ